MTKKVESLEAVKREIGFFIADKMIDYGRHGERLSDACYFARIDGDVYSLGSMQDWDYWDNDGYFWNQKFEDSDEVDDLPNEPDDYDEWQKWNKENVKHKRENHPFWESEECAKERESFANMIANDSNYLGDPIDDWEWDEDDIDFDFEIVD